MNRLNSLTKDKLVELYVNDKRSLDDIAKLYSVSKTSIYKRLKKYSVKQRSKSEARIEAQKQGKLPQQFFDIDENFFSSWSFEMAYVLGLIITDGCVSGSGTVSLSMNDKDLLEKVKQVMGSKHKITPSKRQKGLYCFYFSRKKLVRDLEKLYVVPRKSLAVKFPEIPQIYLPDFLRGVFDGDGSVFFDPRRPKFPIRSKFVSGSQDFIIGLQSNLEFLGMPKRTIYKQRTKNGWSYMFIYGHKDSAKLFEILYKNNQNGLFLERKYKRFLVGLKKFEGGVSGGKGTAGVAQVA